MDQNLRCEPGKMTNSPLRAPVLYTRIISLLYCMIYILTLLLPHPITVRCLYKTFHSLFLFKESCTIKRKSEQYCESCKETMRLTLVYMP
jgi:hypothetical protein